MAANTSLSVSVFTTGSGMAEQHFPLDAKSIRSGIRQDLAVQLSRLEVRDATHSTNDDLLGLSGKELHGYVLLAEQQTAGRGRRGKTWHSAAGNINMSIGLHLPRVEEFTGALSLIVGIGVCRAMSRIGLNGHGIKWPNDIVLDQAKLGGILVETRHRRKGMDAVIGIGINVKMGSEARASIDQPWADLASQPGLEKTDRNQLVSIIIEEILCALSDERIDPKDYLSKHWTAWDVLRNVQIQVEREGEYFEGRAEGITPDGGLRLETLVPIKNVTQMVFHSGEVTVRHA